jgi:hypothetical protein
MLASWRPLPSLPLREPSRGQTLRPSLPRGLPLRLPAGRSSRRCRHRRAPFLSAAPRPRLLPRTGRRRTRSLLRRSRPERRRRQIGQGSRRRQGRQRLSPTGRMQLPRDVRLLSSAPPNAPPSRQHARTNLPYARTNLPYTRTNLPYAKINRRHAKPTPQRGRMKLLRRSRHRAEPLRQSAKMRHDKRRPLRPSPLHVNRSQKQENRTRHRRKRSLPRNKNKRKKTKNRNTSNVFLKASRSATSVGHRMARPAPPV